MKGPLVLRRRRGSSVSSARIGGVVADQHWRVSDRLWQRVVVLLPEHPRRYRFPGRKRAVVRAGLEGILFVLRYGVPWDAVPRDDGRPSGVTCWRRLREWTEAGVWDRLQQVLVDELAAQGAVDMRRALVDSSVALAKKGARKPVAAPPTAVDAASNAT
jgi:transposase